MNILLDTNAYVGFKSDNEELVDYVANSDTVLMSPIVYGELLFGFRNGSRYRQNMAELDVFMGHEAVEMPPVRDITADRFARIAVLLKRQGTPIPTNDIWIAAQTMETGAELVTRDKHFMNVAGLVYRLFE